MDDTAVAPRSEAVDPITYEVLRNRLWSINDQQGLMAARMSGSPAIYEAYDFNAAIMDRDGACLFLGIYVTFQGTSLERIVESVLDRFPDDIRAGDVFVTNDPWAGAMHMNDIAAVAPVFHDGELIAWTGISMHEMDVGGPVPGSFVVGATEVFGESTLIPPLKLVDAGKARPDIEALLLRNTRTASLNALNIRARLSAQAVAHERIAAVVERYGADTFEAVLARCKRDAGDALRRRLEALPDGEWTELLYIDHDGNSDIDYPVALKMSKRDDRLVFDFTGTSPQAPGMVNCTRSGLEGGVMSAVLPMLCYDTPWAPGGLGDVIEIVAEEGTINNATFPAAVSMATISAGWMTCNLANSTIGRMLAASDEFRDEAQACWFPGWHGTVLAGRDQRGEPLAAILMDSAGGGAGARSTRDGIDVAGNLAVVSAALPNVETNERHYPILELYRRHGADTGGAGRYRGGVGAEIALTPHKSPGPLEIVAFSTGCNYPGAPGISGGQPGSVQRTVIARDRRPADVFAQGRVVVEQEMRAAEGTEVLAAKDRTELRSGDVLYCVLAGGGGYGDPLDRSAADVEADLAWGFCSAEAAAQTYGVVVTPEGSVDAPATAQRRDTLRKERLGRASTDPQTGISLDERLSAGALAPGAQIGDNFVLGDDGRLRCARCGEVHGAPDDDPRRHSVVEAVEIDALSPINALGAAERFAAYLYYCQACGSQLRCEVRLKDQS